MHFSPLPSIQLEMNLQQQVVKQELLSSQTLYIFALPQSCQGALYL